MRQDEQTLQIKCEQIEIFLLFFLEDGWAKALSKRSLEQMRRRQGLFILPILPILFILMFYHLPFLPHACHVSFLLYKYLESGIEG